jgi:hypothetical protein
MKLEISPGELIDKYTILLIKENHITNTDKLQYIKTELDLLSVYVNQLLTEYAGLQVHIDALQKVNQMLWNIEDEIREKERLQEFDQRFIELARSVYFTNDVRAKIKYDINEKTNSALREIKQYREYTNE